MTPNAMFAGLVIGLLISGGVCWHYSHHRHPPFQRRSDPEKDVRLAGLSGLIAASFLILMVVSPLFIETAGETIPITFENGGTQAHPEGCWRWPGRKVVPVPQRSSPWLRSVFALRTDDPRSPEVGYWIQVRLEARKFFHSKQNGVDDRLLSEEGVGSAVNALLRPDLEELNRLQARELAQLWVLESKGQETAKLCQLIENSLGPTLEANGLKLILCKFE